MPPAPASLLRARRRVRASAFILCGVLAGCASRQHPPVEVRKLTIDGNKALSDRAIKKKILTSSTGWWWPFAHRQPFDPVAWQTDLQRIERLYEAHGRYGTQVDGEVARPNPAQVELKVQVKEGPPTRVTRLDIEGLEAVPEATRKEVTEDLPVAVGDDFTEGDWEATKSAIADRLREAGHFQATVVGEARVDVARHEAALRLEVRPGPVYNFGPIEVRSRGLNPHAPASWIEEQVALALTPGKRFSVRKLAEAERRVLEMGVFALAKVTPGTPDAAKREIPVVVEVQEGPLRTLRFGGGFGLDQVRNEFRIFSDWTHKNFLGGLRRFTVRGEVGYAFIPNAYVVVRNRPADAPRSGPVFLTGATLEQPRLFGAASLGGRLALSGERRLEQAFTSLEGRSLGALLWRPWDRMTIVPSYQLQVSWIDAPATVPPEVAPRILGCSDNPCLVRLSFLEQTVAWDRRDRPLDARRGHFTSVSFQEGGGPLGGDFDYLRLLVDGRAYVTPHLLDDEFTFAVRLQVGALWPRSGQANESPIVQRFYGGGATSMRGFNERRLSPLLVVPAAKMSDAKVAVPIGGNGLLLASFEARYQLTESLALAVFYDAGRVTQDVPGPSDVAGLLGAAGIGLRYQTPIGPLRVDIARRLPWGRMPVAIDETGARVPYQRNEGCFGIGETGSSAVSDGACVLHLSFGEAF